MFLDPLQARDHHEPGPLLALPAGRVLSARGPLPRPPGWDLFPHEQFSGSGQAQKIPGSTKVPARTVGGLGVYPLTLCDKMENHSLRVVFHDFLQILCPLNLKTFSRTYGYIRKCEFQNKFW